MWYLSVVVYPRASISPQASLTYRETSARNVFIGTHVPVSARILFGAGSLVVRVKLRVCGSWTAHDKTLSHHLLHAKWGGS